MDTEKLRAYCDACLPEQWKALAGADRSKVISGNALVVQGHQMDVNAIVAFANAMPELLDTIERLTKERDVARIGCQLANEQAESDRASVKPVIDKLRKIADERDAARAEVESLKKQIGGLEYHLDAARGEVGRLKGELREGFDAEGSGIELRRRMDAMGR